MARRRRGSLPRERCAQHHLAPVEAEGSLRISSEETRGRCRAGAGGGQSPGGIRRANVALCSGDSRRIGSGKRRNARAETQKILVLLKLAEIPGKRACRRC